MAPALVSAGALLATSIVLLIEILGISRLAFAMARNGDLPQTLSLLSQVKRVPRNAVMACGAILPVLAVSMDLRPAPQASSTACGLASCLVLAFSLPWHTLWTVGSVALTGAIYRAMTHRRSHDGLRDH